MKMIQLQRPSPQSSMGTWCFLTLTLMKHQPRSDVRGEGLAEWGNGDWFWHDPTVGHCLQKQSSEALDNQVSFSRSTLASIPRSIMILLWSWSPKRIAEGLVSNAQSRMNLCPMMTMMTQQHFKMTAHVVALMKIWFAYSKPKAKTKTVWIMMTQQLLRLTQVMLARPGVEGVGIAGESLLPQCPLSLSLCVSVEVWQGQLHAKV